jgi:hypothetical protein
MISGPTSGGGSYLVSKSYNHLMGQEYVHPAFKWIWRSKCQMKQKVFFWLLLHNRLNTRGMLQRRNMIPDSYTCELCLLQRVETMRHVFLLCPFAKKLLGIHRCAGSILVESWRGNNIHEMTHQATFRHGDYYSYVLVHLEREECMVV